MIKDFKPVKEGWVCPKCGTVNAPWMPACGNSNCNKKSNVDWNNVPPWAKDKEIGNKETW